MAILLREPITIASGKSRLTKDLSIDPQDEWRWDSVRSLWLQWHTESKTWVANHKPLPQCFVDANGMIPASLLLQLWKEATSFSELHKHVFWLSKVELQQFLEHLTTECQRYGVKPPSPFSVDDKIGSLVVNEWLEQGLVCSDCTRRKFHNLLMTQSRPMIRCKNFV